MDSLVRALCGWDGPCLTLGVGTGCRETPRRGLEQAVRRRDGDQSESGKVRASSMTRSLASVSPMVTRAPSPANGRTTMPSSSAAAAKSAVRSPSGEPDEVALRLRDVPARRRRRPVDHAVPLGDQRARPARAAPARRSSEAMAAAWATLETPNGSDTARSASAIGGGRDGVPDPEAGQPVGLGEGARRARTLSWRAARSRRRRRRRPSARTRRTPRRRRPARASGTRARKRVELGLGHRRAGRVVGRADHDDLGAVGDRRGHRVEVVPAVGGHRHPDVAGAGGGDRDRVGLEGPPGVDDLVAGLAERLHQLVDQRDRAGRQRRAGRCRTPSRSASAS